jgi:hypothetical protein
MCEARLKVKAAAKVSGDSMSGTIQYLYQSNQHADCAYRNTCVNIQTFNGIRPPKQ